MPLNFRPTHLAINLQTFAIGCPTNILNSSPKFFPIPHPSPTPSISWDDHLNKGPRAGSWESSLSFISHVPSVIPNSATNFQIHHLLLLSISSATVSVQALTIPAWVGLLLLSNRSPGFYSCPVSIHLPPLLPSQRAF